MVEWLNGYQLSGYRAIKFYELHMALVEDQTPATVFTLRHSIFAALRE